MMTLRVVATETLDHLAPSDPAAMRARRDLVRIHRVMRTCRIVYQGWQSLMARERAATPLRILELGAGDGTLLLGVAQALAPHWPRVELTLLDQVNTVDPATLAAYAKVGWAANVVVADVLDWAVRPGMGLSGPDTGMPSPQPPRWDLVTTALFLHHFENAQLALLLAAIASRSDRFFACEPMRSWPALAGSHLVGALGANAVTREDAVLSVRAGFRAHEITAQWPQLGKPWHTLEYAARPFSHCFSARRLGANLDYSAGTLGSHL